MKQALIDTLHRRITIWGATSARPKNLTIESDKKNKL